METIYCLLQVAPWFIVGSIVGAIEAKKQDKKYLYSILELTTRDRSLSEKILEDVKKHHSKDNYREQFRRAIFCALSAKKSS